MDSLSKTLGTFFEERLSNPLISSFAIAWSLYNYKVFVILFSENTVTETFSLIHQRFPDESAVLVHGFVWPAVFAALYLFALPYPTKWVFKWVREKQKAIDDIRDEYEAHKRLTREQSIELRTSMRELGETVEELRKGNRQLQEELKESRKAAVAAQGSLTSAQFAIDEKDRQLDLLKLVTQARAASPSPESFKSDVPPEPAKENQWTDNELKGLQLRLLDVIGAADALEPWQIRKSVDVEKVALEYALQDLVDNKYLDEAISQDGLIYRITQSGRRILLEQKRKPTEQSPSSTPPK